MQSFQDRFKSKSSTVSKTGELNINPERVVNKPSNFQVHSPIKTSGKSIVEQQKSFDRYQVPNTASLSRKIISPKRQLSQAPPLSLMGPLDEIQPAQVKFTEFKPYTLRDYQSIKPANYYTLGGLGPSNIGTDDWIRKKQLIDKRNDYSRKVVKVNRERGLTENEFEILESSKNRSGVHERHSSAFT